MFNLTLYIRPWLCGLQFWLIWILMGFVQKSTLSSTEMSVWVTIWVNIDLGGPCRYTSRTIPFHSWSVRLKIWVNKDFHFNPKSTILGKYDGSIWIYPFTQETESAFLHCCHLRPVVGCQPESGLIAAHFCLFLILRIFAYLHFAFFHVLLPTQRAPSYFWIFVCFYFAFFYKKKLIYFDNFGLIVW